MTDTPTVASVQADIATLAASSYAAGFQAGSQVQAAPPVTPPASPPAQTVNIADYFPQPASGQVWNKFLWLDGDPNMGNIAKAAELWQFSAYGPGWVLTTFLPNGTGGWNVSSQSYFKVGTTNPGWLEYQDYEPPNMYVYAAGAEFNWGKPGSVVNPNVVNQHSNVVLTNGEAVGTFDVTLASIMPSLTTPIGTFENVLVVPFTQTEGSVTTPTIYYMTKGHHCCRVDYPGTTPLSRYALDSPEW